MGNTAIYDFLREKALLLDEILFKEYGGPFQFFSERDPLSEMVASMLSHRTKNSVSGQAYRHLRQALPTWEAVRDAPVEVIFNQISEVTYPEVKAPRIKAALQIITDLNGSDLTLDFIEDWPVETSRAWLEKIPGVGKKTSAATLNFSRLRLPALVVDSHHHRVSQRLGIVSPKASLDATARILESYLPTDWDGQRVYDSHQGFMRHGKQVCHWDRPECERCVVRAYCDYYAERQSQS
jgi:endonuclease-3